jgi:menaquinone-dependent protoporphyrinogen oxidase
MRVLVGYASRYGATDGIAEQIAGTLTAAGHDTTLARLDEAGTMGYDAFVLGSAIYMGNWLSAARRFVDANREALTSQPTWLFSSGPIGDPPKPEGDPAGLTAIVAAVQPREHRVFSGRLQKRRLNLVERAMASALKAPNGDFRDWDAIRAWAEEIAAALETKTGRPR